MELANLVHHEDVEHRSRSNTVNSNSIFDQRHNSPQTSAHSRPSIFSSTYGHSSRCTSASCLSHSTLPAPPMSHRNPQVTLPSIHNLVQASDHPAQTGREEYHDPNSCSPIPASYQSTSKLSIPTLPNLPDGQSHLPIKTRAPGPLTTDQSRTLQDGLTNHGGAASPQSSSLESNLESPGRSRPGMEQPTSPSIMEPSFRPQPMQIFMKTPPSQHFPTVRQLRSGSIDEAGLYSMPRKGSPSSTVPPLPSPELDRTSSTAQWQHHHYISSPTPGVFTNQLTERYTCATCNKPFSRPSSLRIHSHSHTGEKPFKCPQPNCNKSFSVRSNMKRHERGCHPYRKQ